MILMEKQYKNTAEFVRELIAAPVSELGYSLWDVEYAKEGARWILRITIDSVNGITIEDCEKVHRLIDPLLDEADVIETQYFLEVSSPGIERTIRLPEHFLSCVGEKVVLKLFNALNGKKKLMGTLVSYDIESNTITLRDEDKTLQIDRSAVSRANKFFDYN